MTVDEELFPGQHGFAVKFLYEYTKESLPKLDDLLYGNKGTSYDAVFQKFVVICQTYLRDLKKNAQKKTTIVAQQQQILTVKAESKSVVKSDSVEAVCEVKSKKRGISNMDDDNNHEHHKLKKAKKIKKLVKSKKPKKKCSEVANTTADMVRKNMLDDTTTTTMTETVTITTKTTRLSKKTSSVKLKKKASLSSRSSLHISQSKLTKLKLKSKKKSSLARQQQQQNTTELASSNSLKPVGDLDAQSSIRPIASSSIASYSVKSEPMVPVMPSSVVAKTPSKAVHKNLLAIIEASSAQKTGTKAGDEATNAVTASGKVKQMIEMVEARLKTPGNASSSLIKTPMGSKHAAPTPSGTITRSVARNLFSSSSTKTNKPTCPSTDIKVKQVNNPIDNRKQRLSARLDAKRNSLKHVSAFLKDALSTESTVSTDVKPEKNNANPAVKRLFNITSNSANVKQNYKLVGKNSTGKLAVPPSSSSSSNNPMTKRTSFIKFLERNTPSKLTNTELKLDMVAREEQNQRRLEEQKKQTQDKIELAKRKREEKMRKINEIKAKKAESDLKRQEEIEAKLREVEENKKRIMEEKRKERELEKQRIVTAHTAAYKAPEQVSSVKPAHHSKIPTNTAHPLNTFNTHHTLNALHNHQQHHQKEVFKQPAPPVVPTPTKVNHKENYNPYENLSSHVMKSQSQNKTPAKHKYVLPQINPEHKPPMHDNQQPKTPLSTFSQNLKVSNNSASKSGTPYKEAQKVKVYENYNIQELESGDETDDDEQPNKPIPQWAKNPALMNKVKYQGLMMINFTKLFRSSANSNIVLEDIFKIKRKNFTERSSSAFWSSPPVWRTNGLTGDESFRRMK